MTLISVDRERLAPLGSATAERAGGVTGRFLSPGLAKYAKLTPWAQPGAAATANRLKSRLVALEPTY